MFVNQSSLVFDKRTAKTTKKIYKHLFFFSWQWNCSWYNKECIGRIASRFFSLAIWADSKWLMMRRRLDFSLGNSKVCRVPTLFSKSKSTLPFCGSLCCASLGFFVLKIFILIFLLLNWIKLKTHLIRIIILIGIGGGYQQGVCGII